MLTINTFVPTKFIDKTVDLVIRNNMLHIYYTKDLICIHHIGCKKFNYLPEHYREIMKSSAFKHLSDDEIEKIANKNLSVFDRIA